MESSAEYIFFTYNYIQLGVTAENPVRMSQKTMIQLFYNEIQIRGGYSTKLKIHTACLIRVMKHKGYAITAVVRSIC